MYNINVCHFDHVELNFYNKGVVKSLRLQKHE